MNGWANYHRYIQSAEVFNEIDYLVFKALARWMRRRHPNKNVKWLKRKYIRPIKKRDWSFCARYSDARGDLTTLHLLRMVDIVRVDQRKSNTLDLTYNQYVAMRSKASGLFG